MFEAVLIACLLGDPRQQCITASDLRGPYPSAEQCETRLVEMIISSRNIWRMLNQPFVITETTCIKHNGI